MRIHGSTIPGDHRAVLLSPLELVHPKSCYFELDQPFTPEAIRIIGRLSAHGTTR